MITGWNRLANELSYHTHLEGICRTGSLERLSQQRAFLRAQAHAKCEIFPDRLCYSCLPCLALICRFIICFKISRRFSVFQHRHTLEHGSKTVKQIFDIPIQSTIYLWKRTPLVDVQSCALIQKFEVNVPNNHCSRLFFLVTFCPFFLVDVSFSPILFSSLFVFVFSSFPSHSQQQSSLNFYAFLIQSLMETSI